MLETSGPGLDRVEMVHVWVDCPEARLSEILGELRRREVGRLWHQETKADRGAGIIGLVQICI